MDLLIGHWILQKSENLQEFLKALGVGIVLRNIAPKVNGDLTIEKVGEGQFRIQNTNGFKKSDRIIEIGVEFKGDELNGSAMLGKWEVEEDGKMCGQFKGKTEDIFTITREVTGDVLVQTMEFKGCVAKRIYNRK